MPPTNRATKDSSVHRIAEAPIAMDRSFDSSGSKNFANISASTTLLGRDDSLDCEQLPTRKIMPQVRRLNGNMRGVGISSPSDNLSPMTQRLLNADRVKGYVYLLL